MRWLLKAWLTHLMHGCGVLLRQAAGQRQDNAEAINEQPRAVRVKAAVFSGLGNGWGTWIRTKINGVRVRCSTVELSPNAAGPKGPGAW